MLLTIITTLIVSYLVINRIIRSFKIKDYSSKYVFITGCDSGFGKLLAIRLHKLGFYVISGCYTQKGADYLKTHFPERMSPVVLDVTSSNSIQLAQRHVQALLPEGTGLWAVVNNAGCTGNGSVIEMCSMKDFEDCLAVNLYGPIEVAKTFLPLVRRAGGRVVSITSVMGRYPAVSAPYCVSKFGLEAFMDVLRREVYRQGIKVSIIEPGFYKTELLDSAAVGAVVQKSFNQASEEIQTVYGADYVNKIMTAFKKVFDASCPDLDQVIDAYVHAITAKYPRTRYVVGIDANFVFVPASYLPDWLSDTFFHTLNNLLRK